MATGRPRNALRLWTDQQRPDTIGAYGNAAIRTPALDRLAAGGVLFEQAYCTQPDCSPSRASILTGVYPHIHGVTTNGLILPPSIPTLAELLRPQGYACGYAGRWHLGREHAPQRGFEDFWTSTEDSRGGYDDGDPYQNTLSSCREYLYARGLGPTDRAAKFGREEAALPPRAAAGPCRCASTPMPASPSGSSSRTATASPP